MKEQYIEQQNTSDVTNLKLLMPGFYSGLFEDDDNGAISRFLLLLQDTIVNLNDDFELKRKPVLQYMETGTTGFQNFQSSPVLGPLEAQCKKLLPAESVGRVIKLMLQDSTDWQGAVYLVQQFFPNKEVVLEECIEVDRVLPELQMSGLNGKQALGDKSVLGYRLKDSMNLCRFKISPFSEVDLEKLTKDDRISLLSQLMQQYLQQPLEIDLACVLNADAQKNTALGDSLHALLGQKSWLSAPVDREKEIIIDLLP